MARTTGITPVNVNYSQTINTNGANLYDFLSIPSGAKRITLSLNAVSTNGTAQLLVQLGNGAVVTSGYASSAQAFTNTATSTATSTAGFLNSLASAAGSRSGLWVISNAGGNLWVASNVLGDPPTTSNGIGGGTVTLSGTLDRIRITTSNGSDLFDGGSVTMSVEF